MTRAGQTLTEASLIQARQAFYEHCYRKTPQLKNLFDDVVMLARNMSQALSQEHIFLLLQEHPEWVHARADLPGNASITTIIANQFARLIRRDLNHCWLAVLQAAPEENKTIPNETPVAERQQKERE
jgi:hypothetical protein